MYSKSKNRKILSASLKLIERSSSIILYIPHFPSKDAIFAIWWNDSTHKIHSGLLTYISVWPFHGTSRVWARHCTQFCMFVWSVCSELRAITKNSCRETECTFLSSGCTEFTHSGVDARFLSLPWVYSSSAVPCELPESSGWWYRCVTFTF